MKKAAGIFVVAALLFAALFLYYGSQEVPAEYARISAAQAKEAMGDGEAFVLVDVRTPEEFAGGHIEEAVLIPDYEISVRAAEALPDKYARIFVYCRSGRRSEAAAKALVGMGYANVFDFGGILDWPFGTVSG